ncbi:MAG: hypothetical protein ACKVOQ_01100 [Cyclobacteriaceae bacterium]
MQKISKKSIRTAIEDAVGSVPKTFGISAPSKKTKKLVAKVSKELSKRLKKEVKKNNGAKATKAKSNGKNKASNAVQGKKVASV